MKKYAEWIAIVTVCLGLWVMIFCFAKRTYRMMRQTEGAVFTNDFVITNNWPSNAWLTNWTLTSNDYILLTNNYFNGTNFLELTNREYIRIHNTFIIRVTDDEWKLMTNHYRKYRITERISFFGE